MAVDVQRLKRLLEAPHLGLLIEGFDQRRRVFEARLRRARRKPALAAVHDLRVASRRLLSMIALLDDAAPVPGLVRLRRSIRRRLKDLGAMRDVQVQMGLVETLLPGFPQLAAFHAALDRRERRLAKRARERLGEWSLKTFLRRTDGVLDALIAGFDPEVDSRVGLRIQSAVEDAHRRVVVVRECVDRRRPETIHRVRLAFKKFRYMAEIVAPARRDWTPERLEAMRGFQDRMGAIQDAGALLDAMAAYRRRTGRTSVLVAENEVRRRRAGLIEAFVEVADEIRFFRPSRAADTVDARAGKAG